MENEQKWENVSSNNYTEVSKHKVDGGWLFSVTTKGSLNFTTTFVPDVDLTRYESHLRDAYTHGYEMGISDTLQKYRIREGRPESEKVKAAEFRRFENIEL